MKSGKFVHFVYHLFPGMSHYICNTTCYVLPSTLGELVSFQSSFLIRVKFLDLLCSLSSFFFFLTLCLYKSSKSIQFTNFWNRYMCFFTSSVFVRGLLTPSFIIPFLRVSLCLFRMGYSVIKCWEFWDHVWEAQVWCSLILNLYR
jgi:hypothetical protein